MGKCARTLTCLRTRSAEPSCLPWAAAVSWPRVTNLFHRLLTWTINCFWRSMLPGPPALPGSPQPRPAAANGPDPLWGGEPGARDREPTTVGPSLLVVAPS